MGERPSGHEYIAGPLDKEGNLDTSRSVVMKIDSETAENVEKERNIQTVRNLSEVFGTIDLDEDSQHMTLLFQEQGPLVTEYLQDTTTGGQGGEIYNQMAPGIAMLGFEMARSGFGRGEIDSGDEELNQDLELISNKRYKSAEDVFGQLMEKMYPEGTSSGDALLAQLEVPFSEAGENSFHDIKSQLEFIYQTDPDDQKSFLEYQGMIDSLIERVGDEMGVSAENNAEAGLKGDLENEDKENANTDILTLAMVLNDLQSLRKKSIQKKYRSRSYDDFSPTELRKLETLERKVHAPETVDESPEVKEEGEGYELQTFINPIEITGEDGKTVTSESKTEILLSNKQLINETEEGSSGFFGVVYAVDAQLPGTDKKMPFALKEYRSGDDDKIIDDVQQAVQNHRRAKKAGLKVWRTYRMAEDQKSILMTTGQTGEWKLVGNKSSLNEKEKQDLLPIKDYDVFLKELYEEAEKAAENGIFIPTDVPFFQVNKDNLDFMLGDMDMLEASDKDEQELLKENLKLLHASLFGFFAKVYGEVDPETKHYLLGDVQQFVDQSQKYIQEKYKLTFE